MKKIPDKIIGVFDTTFWGESAILDNDDMLIFLIAF